MGSKSIFNLFFFVLLGASGFVACHTSQTEPTAQIRQTKGGSESREEKSLLKQGNTAVRSLDLSQLNSQEQIKMRAQAQDVLLLRSLTRAADRLFQQVWAGYWQDKSSRVNSVFSVVHQFLDSHFSDQGIPLVRKTTVQAACPELDYRMEISSLHIDRGVSVPLSYTLWKVTCSGGQAAKSVLVEIVKQKEPAGIWSYRMKFSKFQEILGSGIELFMHQSSPQCEIKPGLNGRLQKVSCQDIGQNRDKENFIVFPKFNIDVNSPHPVTGEAQVYVLNQNFETVLTRKVGLKDIPFENIFEFDIQDMDVAPPVNVSSDQPPRPEQLKQLAPPLPPPPPPQPALTAVPEASPLMDAEGNFVIESAPPPVLKTEGESPELEAEPPTEPSSEEQAETETAPLEQAVR